MLYLSSGYMCRVLVANSVLYSIVLQWTRFCASYYLKRCRRSSELVLVSDRFLVYLLPFHAMTLLLPICLSFSLVICQRIIVQYYIALFSRVFVYCWDNVFCYWSQWQCYTYVSLATGVSGSVILTHFVCMHVVLYLCHTNMYAVRFLHGLLVYGCYKSVSVVKV